MSAPLQAFERMLAAGRDSAMLRYSLGNEYLKENQPARAAEHLARAVERQPDYSAAWKLLGRAREQAGDAPGAIEAWRRGMEAARAKGDIQAAKEMAVFSRRVEKQLTEGSSGGPGG